MKALGPLSLVVFATACASTPQAVPRGPRIARTFAFKSLPSRPPDCVFEVFEDQQPPRAHVVIGRLPMEVSDYVSAQGRKDLLRDTACRSGADAVLLPPPTERSLGQGYRVREYVAHFLVWADSPSAAAADDTLPPLITREGPQPTAEDGYVIVPVGPEWPEDSIGVEVRQVSPPEAETRSPASR
ncbi:hypothetical protein [Myxococcus landrumensis]|uniref:Lipoprotein n=1 Tax=Myxococcus landrumensis TaxID=2813577 RepID=A0ABX7N7R9_9BACT|nr:hypothetical protein [Myxococcus landrumus]QSQ12413.1 hypothetical protein JY572_29200 [Myxococcus landrumus]